jgi:hypothetical protein
MKLNIYQRSMDRYFFAKRENYLWKTYGINFERIFNKMFMPTNSNVYLDSSLKTAIRVPTLYRLLMSPIPNLMPRLCLSGHLCKESIQIQGSLERFITRLFFTVRGCQPCHPSWRTTACCLSVAAYSIYSQLPSKAGGHTSICKPKPCHAVVKKDINQHGSNYEVSR